MPSLSQLIQEFITLWVVIDPVGTLPVFIAVSAGLSGARSRKLALRAVVVAFFVLLAFIMFGQLVLEGASVSLPSFQIAGGIVLFLFALTMIFGESKPEREIAGAKSAIDLRERAVFPLAIPSIASPGAMLAVVVLTDNDRFSVAHQALTTLMMALVMVATLVILFFAHPILRVIGSSGAAIISRIMGMMLAAVAVDSVLRALVVLGALNPLP